MRWRAIYRRGWGTRGDGGMSEREDGEWEMEGGSIEDLDHIIIMLGSGSYTQKCLIWKTVKQEQLLVYDCESAHLHNLNKFTHHMWNSNG